MANEYPDYDSTRGVLFTSVVPLNGGEEADVMVVTTFTAEEIKAVYSELRSRGIGIDFNEAYEVPAKDWQYYLYDLSRLTIKEEEFARKILAELAAAA